uniref:Ig-like domain-containing protein n=1 Tax=Sinocyclocheilus grahami TaxID=75366 RepID=A0A672KFH2_SINGR
MTKGMKCSLYKHYFSVQSVVLSSENPVVIYAQVGGTVTLQRYRVEGNADNVYVNWYRGSDTIPTIMKNPQRNETTHTVELVSGLPAVMAGDILSLECKVDSSPFKPKVTWIPPQNSDCNQINHYGEKTEVRGVSRCNSGVWTCKLEYDGRKTEATTTVFIIDLSPFPDTIYTSYSSSTVDIPCSFFSNIPWSVLKESGFRGGSWSFTPLSDPKSTQSLLSLSVDPVVRWNITQGANNTIKVKGRELKDHDLSIRNLPVSENIRGVYTCDLKFNTKTLSSEVTVEVLKGNFHNNELRFPTRNLQNETSMFVTLILMLFRGLLHKWYSLNGSLTCNVTCFSTVKFY